MRNKKKFNEFMNKTIEELKDEKRYGTAHVYQSTLNAFCEFCGCKIVYFHQLNRATLKEFETHLRDKQLSWNTVSTYMRTLRGAYNKAVDQKITTGKPRLFNHVYTGVKNDVKRALEVEEINIDLHRNAPFMFCGYIIHQKEPQCKVLCAAALSKYSDQASFFSASFSLSCCFTRSL